MSPQINTICVFLLICTLTSWLVDAKKSAKCRDQECELKSEHFKLYSTIKQAIESDFAIKGKDIVPLVRSVEVLKRRFVSSSANQPVDRQLNGTKLVLSLLDNEKLNEALEVFNSDEGRVLIDLYKASINGNQQNLACSQWRVNEIKFASRELEKDAKLAKLFGNIHKNFMERSARKCLKSSCSSIDDNMNRLDSIQRHSSRRKGFIAHEDLAGKLYDENADTSLDELVAQVDNEPAGEFQQEELELCKFFKRTNKTSCQASGNELSEIGFVKAVKVNNETMLSDLEEFLRDYQRNRWQRSKQIMMTMSNQSSTTSSATADKQQLKPQQDEQPVAASSFLLAQCRSVQALLEYHLFGLRWYQKQDLITSHKLNTRTFWCPSLSYWIEIDRLCNELNTKLSGVTSSQTTDKDNNNNNKINHETFAY